MKLQTLFIAIFISAFSTAETENFSMSLVGDFHKDYCNLSIGETVNNDLDISKIREKQQSFIDAGLTNKVHVYTLGYTFFTLSCSAGKYDIFINNTLPSYEYPVMNSHLHYRQSAWRANFQNIQSYSSSSGVSSGITQNDSYYLVDALIPENKTGEMTFAIGAHLESLDGTWNNLPDSFHFSDPIIVTIDKK